MVNSKFSNKTKVLGALTIVWVILSAILVASQVWSPWVLAVPLVVLLIPTFVSTVTDIFY